MLTVDFCRVFQSQLHFSFFGIPDPFFVEIWKVQLTMENILSNKTASADFGFVSMMLTTVFFLFDKPIFIFSKLDIFFCPKKQKRNTVFTTKNRFFDCEHDAQKQFLKFSICDWKFFYPKSKFRFFKTVFWREMETGKILPVGGFWSDCKNSCNFEKNRKIFPYWEKMETAKIANIFFGKYGCIFAVLMKKIKISLLAWREMETLETDLLAKNCYHKMLLCTIFWSSFEQYAKGAKKDC